MSSDVLVWLLGATSAWILAGVLDKPGNGSDWLFSAPGQEYLWLGLPIVLGALVHDIGDALTVSGCPILWPIPLGRKRWYPVGPPKVMRFRVRQLGGAEGADRRRSWCSGERARPPPSTSSDRRTADEARLDDLQ